MREGGRDEGGREGGREGEMREGGNMHVLLIIWDSVLLTSVA